MSTNVIKNEIRDCERALTFLKSMKEYYRNHTTVFCEGKVVIPDDNSGFVKFDVDLSKDELDNILDSKIAITVARKGKLETLLKEYQLMIGHDL